MSSKSSKTKKNLNRVNKTPGISAANDGNGNVIPITPSIPIHNKQPIFEEQMEPQVFNFKHSITLDKDYVHCRDVRKVRHEHWKAIGTGCRLIWNDNNIYPDITHPDYLPSLSTCRSHGDCPDGHVADASGNLYSFVEIGEQCWLSENLRTRKYNTGEDIDYILSQHNWILTNQYESPAYTECVNDSTEVELVGLFYNWYAIDDERDVCPIGTRVPTIEEVNTMISFAGGINDANNKLKEEGNYFWNIPNGTNDYNFYARGAGYRSGSGGDCRHRNIQASFWTTTTADNNYSTAWQINLYEPITIFNDSRNTGYSIRCIKD